MMKFAVVSRNDVVSIKVSTTVQKQLLSGGLIYDETSPDLVCVIGEDNTFLSAVHKYIDRMDRTFFTGIHTEKIGTFSEYGITQINDFLSDILHKNPAVEEKRLLKAVVGKNTFYALNEIRIESEEPIQIGTILNNEKFDNIQASGICFSTQFGSSMTNKNLGGAIISPRLETIEMCPINLSARDIELKKTNAYVFDPEAQIRVISPCFAKTKIIFDRWSANIRDNDEIEIKLSIKRLKIARYTNKRWFGVQYEQL